MIEAGIVQRHTSSATMETSAGHPIWGALSDLTVSSHSEADLRDLLWYMDGGAATVFARASISSEDSGSTVATEEGGTVSVALAPVSSATPSRPTTSTTWDFQVTIDRAGIRGVYMSLDSTIEMTEGGVLMEIAESSEGAHVGFLLCAKDYDGVSWTYLVPLHRIFLGPRRDGYRHTRSARIRPHAAPGKLCGGAQDMARSRRHSP